MATQYLLTIKNIDFYLKSDMRIYFNINNTLYTPWYRGTVSYIQDHNHNDLNYILAVDLNGFWFIVRETDLQRSTWRKILTVKELYTELCKNELINIIDILDEN